jgi:hypothetical protein
MTLWKWMRRAGIDDGTTPGTTSQGSAQLQEARRRIKLLDAVGRSRPHQAAR